MDSKINKLINHGGKFEVAHPNIIVKGLTNNLDAW